MIRKIPTRRSRARRALESLGEACDRYWWLPAAIAITAVTAFNTLT